MIGWKKALGILVTVAGALLVAYALLTPSALGSGGHSDMGFGTTQTVYTSTNVILAIVGGIMCSAGAMYLIMSRGANQEVSRECIATPSQEAQEMPISGEPSESRNDVVLRLLTGDERTMYRAILESNGEALQKDLINRTKMSNAKVTRVLDRLEKRDLIVRERYGSTNRVKIKTE